jgi:hypothetical protein
MPDVVEVTPVGGYRVHLRFSDGVAGEVDLAGVIGSFSGVFAPLVDASEFARVRVNPDLGTIVWPTGADLCPDVLYSKVTGNPIAAEADAAGEVGSRE